MEILKKIDLQLKRYFCNASHKQEIFHKISTQTVLHCKKKKQQINQNALNAKWPAHFR